MTFLKELTNEAESSSSLTHKVCRKCREHVPLRFFSTNKRGSKGVAGVCSSCIPRRTEVDLLKAIRNAMIQRCTNHRNPDWKHYGGRGIAVCKRWLESFDNFLEDVGPRPSRKHQLDRINNDQGYEPGNVRWASAKIQNRNQRGNVYVDTPDGPRLLVEVAEEAGVHQEDFSTIRNRVRMGWALQKAIHTPIKRKPRRGVDND